MRWNTLLVLSTCLLAGCLAPDPGVVVEPADQAHDAAADAAVAVDGTPPNGPRCSVDAAPVAAPPPTPGAACRAHAPDATTWVGLVGDKLWRIAGDGALEAAYDYALPSATHTIAGRALVVRGRFAFAALAGTPRVDVGAADDVRVTLVVLDLTDATIALEHTYTTAYRNAGNSLALATNARGVVVLGHQYGSNVESRLFTVDEGHLTTWPGALPLNVDADPQGRFAALQYPVPTDLGTSPERMWVDPCADTTTLLSRGQRAMHRDAIAVAPYSRPDLLIETATSSVSVDAGTPDASKILATNPTGFALLGRDGWPWAVLDILQAQLLPLTVELPADLKGFGDPESGYHLTWAISSRGELLTALRDDDVGHAYRSPDGQTWTSIGRPVGATAGLKISEHNGTFVLHATSLSPFVTNDWTDLDSLAVERLDGMSIQLVRPDSGVAVVLHGPAQGSGVTHDHLISDDGLCMQHWKGDTLEFVDATTGAVAASYTFDGPMYPGLYAKAQLVTGGAP